MKTLATIMLSVLIAVAVVLGLAYYAGVLEVSADGLSVADCGRVIVSLGGS